MASTLLEMFHEKSDFSMNLLDVTDIHNSLCRNKVPVRLAVNQDFRVPKQCLSQDLFESSLSQASLRYYHG